LLAEFVNTLPAGGVRLDVDRDRLVLTVRAGRDKAAINGIDAEDFPVITSMKAADFTVTIAAQTLRERISLVEFAAATDDSRPVLAGVLTRFDGDAMMLASADGFRMAVAEGPSGTAVEQRVDVIVPARSYRELARLIGDAEEDIQLGITPNASQIVARFADTEWSRSDRRHLPDVKQIVPREFGTRVDVGETRC